MKKFLSLILIIAMTMCIMSCGENQNVSSSGSKSESGYPVTLTDQIGRTVIIEKKPESVISAYYISTSMIIGLGQSKLLGGVENTPEKRPIYGMVDEDILNLPTVGTVKELDLEKCALINPDLIIIPAKIRKMVDPLEDLGIDVIVVYPESQQLLEESVTIIGKALGQAERAEEMVEYIEEKLAWLKDYNESNENENKTTVYLAGNSSILTVAGPAMYQSSLIENAGGKNVAEEITDTYWAEVSYEQILTWNPDYIILPSESSYKVEDVLSDKNLAGCSAVKKQNVYKVPGDLECLDSPVPGGFLGAFWLTSIINPSDEIESEFEIVMEEYYSEFYGQ